MTEQEKYDDNLRKLLNTGSGNAFRVPEGYFEQFPEQMDRIVSSLPDFEKAPSVNPFSVPENYFEQLPNQLSQTVQHSVSKSRRWKELLTAFLRPQISIPSFALASLIFASFLFFTKPHYVDMANYQEPIDNTLNSLDIASELDESSLVDILVEENKETAIPDQSYEDYLIDNNVDLVQIEKSL